MHGHVSGNIQIGCKLQSASKQTSIWYAIWGDLVLDGSLFRVRQQHSTISLSLSFSVITWSLGLLKIINHESWSTIDSHWVLNSAVCLQPLCYKACSIQSASKGHQHDCTTHQYFHTIRQLSIFGHF